MFLFVTANEHEREAFEKKFVRHQESYLLGKTYHLGKFGHYPSAYIHIYKQGVNNPESVRLVGELIRVLKPVAVVMVGIAFGADKTKQEIGDVLVSEMILPYDDIKLRKCHTEYKEIPREVGFQLLNAFREHREWVFELPNAKRNPNVYIGAMLTGSCLIDNYEFRTKLLNDFVDREPIGGEMEAFGIYRETRMFKVPEWIIVKGICDWAYDKNVDKKQKDKDQSDAAHAAADYCYHVFSRDGVFNELVSDGRCDNRNGVEDGNKETRKSPKYIFTFKIDVDGSVDKFSKNTTDAITDWYNNIATDIILEMRDENLRDTFEVVVEDLRIQNIDQILGEIYVKLKNKVELTDYESYLALGVNVLKRDNAFITSAIELFLSNRIIRALLHINNLLEIENMIVDILNFKYDDLVYKIPNNKELTALDVFLNSNGVNTKHEQFIAYINENHIKERFGGAKVWDLYERSVIELGKYMRDIAIYYLIYLAELELSGFDFSKDSRMLNLSIFWIGLH